MGIVGGGSVPIVCIAEHMALATYCPGRHHGALYGMRSTPFVIVISRLPPHSFRWEGALGPFAICSVKARTCG